MRSRVRCFFFFQAEDGIRDVAVTGVQTCALPIYGPNMVGGLAAIRPTVITSGVRGAVVGGGGAPAGPVTGNGGGDFHAIYDSDGTIGGGFGNKVGNANANVNDAPFGTVGGGVFNGAANYASTGAGGDGEFCGGGFAA